MARFFARLLLPAFCCWLIGFSVAAEAVAKSDLVVEARTIEVPDNVRIRRLPCRVQKLELLTPDVMGLYLRLPGFEPFEFLAGQYVDILLTGGGRRSFSIASPPHDAGLIELHVRRVPGGLQSCGCWC